MKTLKRKPSLEVLEDRVALSGGGDAVPTESFSLNLRAETRPADVAVIRIDTGNMRAREQAVGLLVENAFGDVLTYIEQDNLYKFRAPMNFALGDGSVRLKAGLMGSAESLRGGSSFMIGEDIPDLDAKPSAGAGNRFQEEPPRILIGLLLP